MLTVLRLVGCYSSCSWVPLLKLNPGSTGRSDTMRHSPQMYIYCTKMPETEGDMRSSLEPILGDVILVSWNLNFRFNEIKNDVKGLHSVYSNLQVQMLGISNQNSIVHSEI